MRKTMEDYKREEETISITDSYNCKYPSLFVFLVKPYGSEWIIQLKIVGEEYLLANNILVEMKTVEDIKRILQLSIFVFLPDQILFRNSDDDFPLLFVTRGFKIYNLRYENKLICYELDELKCICCGSLKKECAKTKKRQYVTSLLMLKLFVYYYCKEEDIAEPSFLHNMNFSEKYTHLINKVFTAYICNFDGNYTLALNLTQTNVESLINSGSERYLDMRHFDKMDFIGNIKTLIEFYMKSNVYGEEIG